MFRINSDSYFDNIIMLRKKKKKINILENYDTFLLDYNLLSYSINTYLYLKHFMSFLTIGITSVINNYISQNKSYSSIDKSIIINNTFTLHVIQNFLNLNYFIN